MSDYDNRQYRLMLDQIEDFKSNRIDLKHLINGLESLLCVLEKPDADWKTKFRKKWGVLEEVYAVALDQKSDLTQNDWNLVNAAVEELRQLLTQVYK
jgi:hypothetical protein